MNRSYFKKQARACSILFTLVLSISAISVSAQTDVGKIGAETMRPAIDREGIIDVESGDVRQHLDYDLALWGWYADDPLKVIKVDNETEVRSRLVRQRIGGALTGALSLANWLELGISIPYVVYQSGDSPSSISSQTGGLSAPTLANWIAISDIRVVPKLRILSARKQGVNLALLGNIWIPFRYPDGEYIGDDTFRAEPMLALSKRHAGGFKWAFNVGALLRFPQFSAVNLDFGHDLDARIGLSYNLGPATDVPLGFDISTRGQMQFSPNFANGDTAYENSVETSFGLHYDVTRAFQIFAGAGLGILAGPGTPDWRAFGGLRWSPQRCDDRDDDGVCDGDDQCPDDPGEKDSDTGRGCPNDALDSDGDGILDEDDECPEQPGPEDSSEGVGCPADGPVDSDGDGLLDPEDNCPQKPGPRMFVGCPDTDGDGFPDSEDECPEEAEIINGNEDDDGCPDEGESLVSLDNDHIEIRESVYFETAKSVIKKRSYNLLDQVAHILRAHPEIAKCRVEGHTDSRGGHDYNQNLSQQRADAVREFLIEHGVAASRLTSEGFGEDKPIASNNSKSGRQKNRRVDFYVTEYTDR